MSGGLAVNRENYPALLFIFPKTDVTLRTTSWLCSGNSFRVLRVVTQRRNSLPGFRKLARYISTKSRRTLASSLHTKGEMGQTRAIPHRHHWWHYRQLADNEAPRLMGNDRAWWLIGPRIHCNATGRQTTVGENCQNKTIHYQLIGLTGRHYLIFKKNIVNLYWSWQRVGGGGKTVITNKCPS